MTFQSTTPVSKHKPVILCLHGGGANASIFNMQAVRIQRVLSEHFEFFFLDAPFETGAGPGVLPFFEGCTPFRRWVTETGQVIMPDKTRDLLLKTLRDQKKKDGRGFVGVMGFSQGGRVAAGLLLSQQLKNDANSDLGELQFGVFLNSVWPPMVYGVSEADLATKIDFPSLHVVGTGDPWQEGGRRLYEENFNPEKSLLMEFNVAHRLPVQTEDTGKVAAEILRMYRHTTALKSIADTPV